MHVLFKIIAVFFLLFIVLFVAIVIEESFLAGRRRRRLGRELRKRLQGERECPGGR